MIWKLHMRNDVDIPAKYDLNTVVVDFPQLHGCWVRRWPPPRASALAQQRKRPGFIPAFIRTLALIYVFLHLAMRENSRWMRCESPCCRSAPAFRARRKKPKWGKRMKWSEGEEAQSVLQKSLCEKSEAKSLTDVEKWYIVEFWDWIQGCWSCKMMPNKWMNEWFKDLISFTDTVEEPSTCLDLKRWFTTQKLVSTQQFAHFLFFKYSKKRSL